MCSPPLRTDGTSADPEGSGDIIRERFFLDPVIRVGGPVDQITRAQISAHFFRKYLISFPFLNYDDALKIMKKL
jgi:hypothetical protein